MGKRLPWKEENANWILAGISGVGRTLRNLSIKWKIFIPFQLLIALTGGMIAYVSYHLNLNSTTAYFSQIMSDTVERTDQTFEVFFKNVEDTLVMLSESLDVYQYRKNGFVVLNKFREFQMANDGIVNLYIAGPEGDMLAYPVQKLPEGYDPRKEDWYIKGMEGGGSIFWSKPHKDLSGKEEVVTASREVKTLPRVCDCCR